MINSPGPFNKIQQVSSFCGLKVKDFVRKNKFFILKCPFCEHEERG